MTNLVQVFFSKFHSFFSLTKKLFLIFAVYFICLSLFTYFINKDRIYLNVDPVKRNRAEILKTIKTSELNKTKEGRIMLSLYKASLCSLIGETCSDNPENADKDYPSSLMGKMSSLVSLPFANPPASATYWAFSGLENAGFIPKTYAAEGLGFSAMKPFINIWKMFRDLSYMLLVVVLIAIGFMVMFRSKINPQTVISVENSLPKIVVTMILITFSFAIAGFIIDLMYVVIILAISLLSNHNNFFEANKFIDKYTNANMGTLFLGAWPGGFENGFGFGPLGRLSQSILNILPWTINQILRTISGITVGIVITKVFFSDTAGAIVKSFGNAFKGFSAAGVAQVELPIVGELIKGNLSPLLFIAFFLITVIIGYAALPLILAILILFSLIFLIFRIFFLLISSYIKIILLTIFSPIILLFEAIPGKSTFSYWIKSLIGEVIVFPTVIVLLLVGYILYGLPTYKSVNLWQPPFLYGFEPDAFAVIISMGLIFLIPDFIKMIKQFIGIKDLPLNFGLGTFFGGVGAAWGGSQSGLGMLTSLTQMPFVGSKIIEIAGKNKWMGNMLPPQQGQLMAKKLAELKKAGEF